jgi:hypothetical protein
VRRVAAPAAVVSSSDERVDACADPGRTDRMTQLLERALEEVRKLSPVGQDAIASIILEEIQDEELWDQTFARSQDKLARMAAKAREDIRAGRTKDLEIDEL